MDKNNTINSKKLRKDLNLFHKLVSDYLTNKDHKKKDTINSLYNSLIERLNEESVERRAIDTLKDLIK